MARYTLLDSWRGIAALAVVFHHVSGVAIGGPAVMIFFVISGYCITHAALIAASAPTMRFVDFMKRRIYRIYPPYLLSIVFFMLTRLLKWGLTGENQLVRPWLEFIQNITLTQWTALLFSPIPRAADNSSLFVASYWSLGYEEQFYLLMGLGMLALRYIHIQLLWPALLLIIGSLAWNAHIPLSHGLFIEYWAMFGIGTIVYYRLRKETSLRLRFCLDGFLASLLVISLLFYEGESRQNLLSAALFGALLITLYPYNDIIARTVPGKILQKLGIISYSLYLIHQFNLTLITQLSTFIVPRQYYALSISLQILLHIGLASFFWKYCERPFRNRPI